MTLEQRPYRLTTSELEALASGEYTAEIIERLRSAEYSRNSILAEALRRSARSVLPRADRALVKSAMKILSNVHARSPGVAAQVLMSPHFGFWVADCVMRLRNPATRVPSASAATRGNIRHITAFAAVAALMASHHFELTVPVLDGHLYLPGLGSLNVSGQGKSDQARVRFHKNGLEITVRTTGRRTIALAATSADNAFARLQPVARISTRAQGLSLDLLLDNRDPFLCRLGPVVTPLTEGLISSWQTLMDEAWATLVSHHRPTARSLAQVVTTMVPLVEPKTDHPISVTSGWAWGAIGLSLPSDRYSLAETLIHEFRHLVLAAVEDIIPLTRNAGEGWLYSPWRDDPRPASNLLQATYAFSGVAAYWEDHRQDRLARLRRRAELAFAIQRLKVLQSVRLLQDSGALTSAGLVFVNRIQQQATDWIRAPIDPDVGAAASEIVAEHQLRWRLANLVPEDWLVEALAGAWVAHQAAPAHENKSALRPAASSVHALRDRSRSLQRRFLRIDSAFTGAKEPASMNHAEDALMSGENARARDAYVSQVSDGGDRDAWIGLVLVLRRLGVLNEDRAAQHPIETIAAVGERVRAAAGRIPDVEALVLWVTEALGPSAGS